MASTIWSVLRNRSNRGAAAARLMLNTGAITVGFVCLVVAISWAVPSDARKFTLEFARIAGVESGKINVEQTSPFGQIPAGSIEVLSADDEKPKTLQFDLPTRDRSQFKAVATLPADTATASKTGKTQNHHQATGEAVFRICVDSSEIRRPRTNDSVVTLDCKRPEGCTLKPSAAWAQSCPAEAPPQKAAPAERTFAPHSYFLLNAAEPPKSMDAKSLPQWWRVPTLDTLEALRTRGTNPSYATFRIHSKSVPQGADSYVFSLRANGVNLLVDGLDPPALRKPLQPGKGFDLAFGLETLNFSGSNNGCERIDVGLDFASAGKTIRHVELTRQYAALRRPAPSVPDGLEFDWLDGDYFPSRHSGTHEILIVGLPNSAASLRSLQTIKSLIDNSGLRYPGRVGDAEEDVNLPVVAVIRPALRGNQQLGLVLALTRRNGQVLFTFDEDRANAFLKWTLTDFVSWAQRNVARVHLIFDVTRPDPKHKNPFLRRTDDQTGTEKDGVCDTYRLR